MASSTTDNDLGLKQFMRELEKAKRVVVEIGIHTDAKNEGESVAQYGAYNEFGTGNIPERSFMRSTFDENTQKISQDLNNRYNQVKSGQLTVYTALKLVGERHVGQIQLKIGSNISPANSPATIKRKGSSKTLIDTGIMRNSIRAIVRAK